MLTINPNEEKTINFVVEINGVGCEEMTGHVRFSYGDVEYGFPVEFHGDEITATIKPLNEIFDGKLKNGMTLAARLDQHLQIIITISILGQMRLKLECQYQLKQKLWMIVAELVKVHLLKQK